MAAVLAAFSLSSAQGEARMATAYWKDDQTRQAAGAGSFWASGHTPTLIAAFLYFDLAFMVWVLLGPLAPEIARSLMLTPAEKGLMVATPTLAGAILRVVNGLRAARLTSTSPRARSTPAWTRRWSTRCWPA